MLAALGAGGRGRSRPRGWAPRGAGVRGARSAPPRRSRRPFLAPLLVLGGAGAVAFVARVWGFPIRGPGGILGAARRRPQRGLHPLCQRGLLGLRAARDRRAARRARLTIRASRAPASRRAPARARRRAARLPGPDRAPAPPGSRSSSASSSSPPGWPRRCSRGCSASRATTAAYLVVAALVVGLTITHDQSKPLDSAYGRPWQLSQQQALIVNSDGYLATALAAYDRLVPADACVGAVLGTRRALLPPVRAPPLEHRVVYLSVNDAVLPALRRRPLLRRHQHRPRPLGRGRFAARGLADPAARDLLAARLGAARRRRHLPGVSNSGSRALTPTRPDRLCETASRWDSTSSTPIAPPSRNGLATRDRRSA